MRREGRQLARCNTDTVSRLCGKTSSSSPPADLELLRSHGYEPTKPASPWKHAGRCKCARCRSCHLHPISKSKDKAKGARKLRSCDVALNHRLVSWRVVDGDGGGMRCYTGASASGIVGYLSGYDHEEEEEDQEREAMGEESGGFWGDPTVETRDVRDDGGVEVDEIEEEDDDDDDMGFYQVGIVWEYLDEDWCVVTEM